MTKRQRAQVVELLRCAADEDPIFPGTSIGLFGAGIGLGHVEHHIPDRIYDLAQCARFAAVEIGRVDWRALNLEAAQRVEEKSWP